tara:strand:+ start:60 stop:305 length:246 start_codon:yes stop_codon:yes gene_type:complete
MIENEYEKFEDLEVTDKRRVWWATTDEIICDWNDKKFTIRIAETSKGGEIIWMAGEDQFTDEEISEIEEYLWSGEADVYIE